MSKWSFIVQSKELGAVSRKLLILLGVVLGLSSYAHSAEEEVKLESEPIDLGSLLHQGRPAGIFSLTVDNDAAVCGALLTSLNSSWPANRQTGPHILMRNDYLIDPWRMRDRIDGPGTTEVAFVDIDGDEVEDALFRTLTTVGRDYHMLHIVRSVDPQLRFVESLSKQQFRSATRGQEPEEFRGIGKLGRAYYQFVEVVEISTHVFLLILDIDYVATEKTPQTRPIVQVVKVERKSGLARICTIVGQRPIRLDIARQ